MPPGAIRLDAIHHIGVVVDDLGDGTKLLAALGLRPAGRSDAPDVRTAFFECSGTCIELIEFRSDDARLERLGDASARIDHIAFAVPDLDESIAELAKLGIETTPAQAAGGRRTCWTVASTTDGVVYQLVETA